PASGPDVLLLHLQLLLCSVFGGFILEVFGLKRGKLGTVQPLPAASERFYHRKRLVVWLNSKFSVKEFKTRFTVSERGRALSISQLRMEDAGTYSVNIDGKKSTFTLLVYSRCILCCFGVFYTTKKKKFLTPLCPQGSCQSPQ
uniref:Immunoglobulin V-set domain-containing protein n=1 Tax=Zosterops lateralis melanops TaxID=1220523 RepID=A0A8D2QL56_ZOSLA